MKRKLKFYWVDDDSSRQSRINSINNYRVKGGVPRANVSFIEAAGKKLDEIINEILRLPEPDLLLIDHFLNLRYQTGSPGISKGSTVAQIIRASWPSCPVIGITAAEKRSLIKWQGESVYDALYVVDSLRKNYSALFIAAYYFNVLKRSKPKNKEEIVRLLGVPDDDKQQLLSIMPDFLLQSDIGQVHRIFAWIKFELMDRAGFLLNKLWVATMLGIKEESMYKVERLFQSAVYKGLFSDSEDVRWWSSKVKRLLFAKVTAPQSRSTWELGHKLPRINSRDFSRCYKCEEKYPEIVAFTDKKRSTLKPMHLKCTYSDPSDKRKLYFQEYRIMKRGK